MAERHIGGCDARLELHDVELGGEGAIPQDIVAVAEAEEVGVVANPSLDRVVAGTAVENVVAARTEKHIVALAPEEGVVAGDILETEEIVAAQNIVTRAAVDRIRARAADEHVVAVRGLQRRPHQVAGKPRRSVREEHHRAVHR